jgi:ATP-dependent helicase/DNAse subunit B
MPIALITGPANAGKAQVVMEHVRRHLARGQEPVLVVPTRADTEHYRRELAGAGAAIGARVERFDGLMGEAVRRAGVSEPVLGAIARLRLLGAAAAASPRPQPIEDRPSRGFVRALADVVAELQVRRITPARLGGALAALRAADGDGLPAGALDALYARYRRMLDRIGRLDSEQRAVGALDALRRAPALWQDTPVLFYGFDDLTPLQLDAIETLGSVVGAEVTVSLAYEAGRTAFAGRAATFQALAPLASNHHELTAQAEYYAPRSRAALSHLERSLFEPVSSRVEPGGAVHLLEGGGQRAELELVAGEITTLLAGGMPAEEIAIVVRIPATPAELLEEVLGSAGVPYALQRHRPFADTAIGAALLGLLRCVPADGGELGDLLAWLRAPGLLERPELADALERTARRLGASSAARSRALWEEDHWPLASIDQLRDSEQRGPAALADRAARELQWLFCAPRRRAAKVLAEDEIDEAHALGAGRRALGELRELARMAPELAVGDAGELARSLQEVEILSGERPAAGRVAVLDPLALRARRVRALFLCGLQEGVFPSAARPQPFLGEEERRRLAETSGLRLGEPPDALAAERHLFYAAVSRPEELLYLSWHVASDDGEPRARSLFVDDVCDLFEQSLDEHRARRPLGAVGPTAGKRSRAPGAAEAQRPPGAAGPAGVAARPSVSERLAPLRDELLLAELRARPWSASSLEAWISCPARWFVERLLRPGDFDPESEPLARGALAHDALKATLEGLRRETGSARLSAARLPLARELLQTALREKEPGRPLSVAPERLAAARRRLQADLERYLDFAATVQSDLEPRFLEVEFGFVAGDREVAAEEREAVAEEREVTAGAREVAAGALPAYELGDGVALRGRIDRIDVGESGEAVVYDYKNRAAPAAAKWIKEGNVQIALYMLAAEELLGVRPVGGFYQPLSGHDLRARGVLDADSGVEIECVRGDSRAPEEVRELLGEALALARQAAAEAKRGEFESRPQSCGWGGRGCMYPTICRCEQ